MAANTIVEIAKPAKVNFTRAKKTITNNMTVGEAKAIERARAKVDEFFLNRVQIALLQEGFFKGGIHLGKFHVRDEEILFVVKDDDFYVTERRTFSKAQIEADGFAKAIE